MGRDGCLCLSFPTCKVMLLQYGALRGDSCISLTKLLLPCLSHTTCRVGIGH